MDQYYSDLTTSAMNKAVDNLISAYQYAQDANAPERILHSIDKLRHGAQNRINDILDMREPRKK